MLCVVIIWWILLQFEIFKVPKHFRKYVETEKFSLDKKIEKHWWTFIKLLKKVLQKYSKNF